VSEVVLRGGPPVHPWIFSKRVQDVRGRPRDGDVVSLKTREGRACGFGFWHSKSLIAVRVLSYLPDRAPDGAWLAERLAAAERLRVHDLRLPEITNAWRTCHGEADGLSGLVVDRYGDTAVASLYSLGWFRRIAEVEKALKEALGVQRVIARTDERTAVMEGFRCDPPSNAGKVEIQERGTRYVVDLEGGHKTGFFLDQRDHRELIARISKGRRVFDGMTYTGGFAMAAATRGGAASVVGVDLDETAIAVGQESAKRNGCKIDFQHADVFDVLRTLSTGPAADRPDLLIVDPAKWAKERTALGAAMAKYADLNRLALSAVADGGLVLTCSCSGLVSSDDFVGMLRGIALDLRTDLRFLHVGGAAPDHPVSASFPEGRYLKCVLIAPGKKGEGPGRSDRPERPDRFSRGDRPSRATIDDAAEDDVGAIDVDGRGA
jgi:23S rRNA (cytosine1962-C5)-methyltransferase